MGNKEDIGIGSHFFIQVYTTVHTVFTKGEYIKLTISGTLYQLKHCLGILHCIEYMILKLFLIRRSTDSVLVTTLPVENELQINRWLPVTLEISSISTNITGKYFTYKPDPTINDVNPRQLPIRYAINLMQSRQS